MLKIRQKKNKADFIFLGLALALLLVGMAVLYSASAVISFSKYKTPSHYFFNQLEYGVAIGLMAMYLCSKINYQFWQKYAPAIIICAVLLLGAVFALSGHNLRVGNASRWLVLGPITIQPAEIAKLGLVIYVASWIDKRRHEVRGFFYGFLPLLIIIGLVIGLVIKQPDIGTSLILLGTAYFMLLIGGLRTKYLIWIFALGISGLGLLIKLEPYRLQRWFTFLNPDADPQGIGYQINQALVAIGSAGFWGRGYGNSRQKYNFLPEVMGDSIFAVTVEELGFLRSGLIVGLFVALAMRGIKIAKAAPDYFGTMLVSGIVIWISLQAIINIGAIIGLLPLTGVPLPFISYGSSSLIITLAAVGIIINVSKQRQIV